jgi:hypothetical protein
MGRYTLLGFTMWIVLGASFFMTLAIGMHVGPVYGVFALLAWIVVCLYVANCWEEMKSDYDGEG